MIGFIAHAGVNVQSNVMGLLPSEINIPSLPYVQELTDELNVLKEDEIMKDKLNNVSIPDLLSLQKIKINMNSNTGYEMPKEMIELMQSSDVTTITENCKLFSKQMFLAMLPDIISNIQGGIQSGIDGLNYAGAASPEFAKTQINEMISKMTELKNAVPVAFDKAKENYLAQIDDQKAEIEREYQKTLNKGFKQLYLTVTISSLIALIILAFYKTKKEPNIYS